MRNAECGMRNRPILGGVPLSFRTPYSALRTGFTLIELLVVISIMALLAALTFGVLGGVHKTASISAASAELGQIESALEDYKGQYGVYPPSNPLNPLLNPLYYELVGVMATNNVAGSAGYVTLDGASGVKLTDYTSLSLFNVGGAINCIKPGDTESAKARPFLSSLKQNRIGSYNAPSGNPVNLLITSVRGPDASYMPLGPAYADINPFRYAYPGTNNPNSYDLWIQLVISGKTNLICNWSKNPIKNSPLP